MGHGLHTNCLAKSLLLLLLQNLQRFHLIELGAIFSGQRECILPGTVDKVGKGRQQAKDDDSE